MIERSVRTFVDHFDRYLATVGILLLLVAGFNILQSVTVGPAFADLGDPSTTPNAGQIAQAAGMGLLLGVASMVLSLAVIFFGLAVTWDVLEGRSTGLSETWGRHGDRFLSYLGLTIVVGLAVAGVLILGMALFFLVIPLILGIVGAIYLVLRWYVAPAALLFEGQGIRDAMSRSAALTKGEKVSLFGIVFLLILVNVAVSLPVYAVLGGAPAYGPGDPSQATQQAMTTSAILGDTLATYVSQLITIPLGAAAVVHAFRDLRGAEQESPAGEGPPGTAPAGEPQTVQEPGAGDEMGFEPSGFETDE